MEFFFLFIRDVLKEYLRFWLPPSMNDGKYFYSVDDFVWLCYDVIIEFHALLLTCKNGFYTQTVRKEMRGCIPESG